MMPDEHGALTIILVFTLILSYAEYTSTILKTDASCARTGKSYVSIRDFLTEDSFQLLMVMSCIEKLILLLFTRQLHSIRYLATSCIVALQLQPLAKLFL